MDDEFMHGFRREPSPEFARRLRASLLAQESDLQSSERRTPATASAESGREANASTWAEDKLQVSATAWTESELEASGAAWAGNGLRPRATKWAAMVASIGLVGLAFAFPSVRAGAQAFLDLFRVTEIVGVSFDTERLQALDFDHLDVRGMLGEQAEALTAPGPPRSFASREDASDAAMLEIREPAWIPAGWEREGFEVVGEHAARVVARTAGLEFLMQQLGIDDLAIPPGLDGQTVTLRVPPVVKSTYGSSQQRVELWQALSPEVSFPAGVDLARLAEIGLRILGLDREDAFRLAGTIDWRSTLIVPVPAAEASFGSVDVAGREGLLIQSEGNRGQTMLLWATEERVFALGGNAQASVLLDMATTLR